MHRRDFIKQSVAVAATHFFPLSALADTSIPKFIDCHSHVFNADDLPINGFINNVVLPAMPALQEYETEYGHVIRFLIRFVRDWATKYAPSANDECVEVEKLFNNEKPPRSIIEADLKSLRDLIDQIKSLRIQAKNFSTREGLVSAYLPGILVGMMEREAFPKTYTGKGYLDNSDYAFDPDKWEPTKAIADNLYRNQTAGPISHYLNWALVYTHFRYEIAEELERVHGGRALLATPALIDFSNWLDDPQEVALNKQVDAMAWVSRIQAKKKNRLHVHGFAPFDPLREALNRYVKRTDPEMPLALAQRAVREQGFIGVKLYPPMGFLPLGNKGVLSARSFPDHLDLKFRQKLAGYLDVVLSDLYEWCEKEHVPILAHARDSNGLDPSSSGRANPDNWSPVLKAYPGLRLSLAHFGDFKEGFATGRRKAKLTDTWEYKMAHLVQQNPNSPVYMDISYFDRALLPGTNNITKEIFRMFRSVLSEVTGPITLTDRILFGTDWTLFGQEALFTPVSSGGQYADLIFKVLSSKTALNLGTDTATQIMFKNAGTFLGLGATAPDGNSGRLKAFYAKFNLDAGWLNEFST